MTGALTVSVDASIAVHTAYQDGTPMLLMVGPVVSGTRGREAFQERTDPLRLTPDIRPPSGSPAA